MKFPARAYSFVRFLPVCLFYFSAANADVLVLKNGDRITGEISRIWDGEVTIEPEYSDEFEVDIKSVEYIESPRLFEVDLKDGRTFLASFGGAAADGNQIIKSGDRSVSVPLAALFELDEPQDPFEWESNVAVSLDMNKGNTDTANGQIRADTMVRFDDHRHFGEVTLSREEVTDPTTNIRSTTKEQDIFRYNYNFLFNDPWFFASSFTFERDPIAELDSRVIISAGVGRDVWNTPRRSLSVQLGAGFQQEELSSNTTDSTVATWTLRYRQDLFGDDVGVFHNQSITHNITGRTNTSYRTSTGLSYEITDLLTSNISLDFDYQTDPAEAAENEDLTLLFGLALEF
jgi:putative salt-induced outer membrane protein YdiY